MKHLLVILFLFTCALSKAQVNLVLNPDFEQYSQCPTQFDQISRANHWSAIDSAADNPFCGPEYCHVCGAQYTSSIPINQCFYQYPRSGNGFAQIVSYYDENDPSFPIHRDYLLGRFSQALEDGKTYCITFYVNFAETSQYFTDKIGAYLDDGSICNVNNCSGPLTQFQPQIENNTGLITDTLNWVKIEGSYTATGSEKFITIGNFYDTANTTATPAYTWNIGYSWLLIEDVSIIESDLDAYAGPDTWVVEGDSVFIGRTPEVGLDCKWLINGSVIDSGAGIWAKPTVTTTYVVEQTICGLTKTDTVIVEVWPVGVNGITNGNQVNIYPNPAGNILYIEGVKEHTSYKLFSITGTVISTGTFNAGINQLCLQDIQRGMYLLHMGAEVIKVVKE